MGNDERQAAWSSLVLLEGCRLGDNLAAEALFYRYFERLKALAQRRLPSRLMRRADPEDVVMSVYRSFFVGARAGRFTLTRTGDLWRLLSAITKHKLFRQIRRHMAGQRSLDREVSVDQIEIGLLPAQQQKPSAEETAAFSDELEWIFGHLDATGRRILELRVQGAELAEIAQATSRSHRTVRRVLAQARDLIANRKDDPDPLLSHQDFVLERMIGSGRMGKVYEAWQHSSNRAVAVKFLRKSLLGEPYLVERFIDESRIVARLRHTNIVGVQGLGRTTGGSYFLVMDLVRGPNLVELASAGRFASPRRFAGPSRLALPSSMPTLEVSSIATSSLRICCSHRMAGYDLPTSAWRGRSPLENRGRPRSKEPDRSWRRSRYHVPGVPSTYIPTSMASERFCLHS